MNLSNSFGKLINPTILCLLLASCTSSKVPRPFEGTAFRVHDGDTLSVKHGTDISRVRLARIDAPELDQDFGPQSRNRLVDLCDTKVVHISPIAVDRDKRIIADVVVDGANINQTLVREGLARWYQDFDKNDSVMSNLEIDARKLHKGLWHTSHPVPPWEFRRIKRDASKQRTANLIALEWAIVLLIVCFFIVIWLLLRKISLRRR